MNDSFINVVFIICLNYDENNFGRVYFLTDLFSQNLYDEILIVDY